MDGGIEGRGSAGRSGKMSRGDAHRREGRIDDGQVPVNVGLVGEMWLVFQGRGVCHNRGIASAHSHA